MQKNSFGFLWEWAVNLLQGKFLNSSQINLTTSGIYKPFRTENLNQIPQLTGKIDKPTGEKNTNVTLEGTYEVQWQTFCSSNTCLTNWRYCIIEITLNKKHEISITQTACKKYER